MWCEDGISNFKNTIFSAGVFSFVKVAVNAIAPRSCVSLDCFKTSTAVGGQILITTVNGRFL